MMVPSTGEHIFCNNLDEISPQIAMTLHDSHMCECLPANIADVKILRAGLQVCVLCPLSLGAATAPIL